MESTFIRAHAETALDSAAEVARRVEEERVEAEERVGDHLHGEATSKQNQEHEDADDESQSGAPNCTNTPATSSRNGPSGTPNTAGQQGSGAPRAAATPRSRCHTTAAASGEGEVLRAACATDRGERNAGAAEARSGPAHSERRLGAARCAAALRSGGGTALRQPRCEGKGRGNKTCRPTLFPFAREMATDEKGYTI